jgi:hypothetical protein
MPLCPQITITPITVTTTGMTQTSIIPIVAATTEETDELQTEINTIETAVNGKNHIYRQATAPDGSVYPLTEGDIWFDTDDGNIQYYWTGIAWVSVRDLGIAAAEAGAAAATAAAAAATSAAAAAAAAATAAQTTADGKNRIYRQTTMPTTGPFAEGDLWFDTDDDNKFYRYTSGAFSAFTLGNEAIASLSATKLTAGTIDASVITVSNINAGNISTGVLNADRIQAASITGAKLVAGTIESAQIATGTIQAVNIAAGTITGEKIAAGTITAGKIATGTITADQIAAYTITGNKIDIGTVEAINIAAETITALEIEAGSITVDRLQVGTLTAFTLRTSAGARRVTISAANNAISFTESSSTVGWVGPAATSGVLMHYGATFNANATTYPLCFVSSGSAILAQASTRYLEVNSLGVIAKGDLYSPDNFYNQDTTTTTNAANTWMSSTTGLTRRSTASSQRYKENIVDIRTVADLDPRKLLDLPVRAFKYKADYLDAADDRSGALLPGFIAEEVATAYSVAADQVEGVIESWNDRYVVPGLLALIQDLHTRVEILEGNNA